MKDITGNIYHYLTVLHYSHRINRKHYWLCRCKCGVEKVIETYKLGRDTKSCGCYSKERTSEVRKIHGMSKSRFYGIWNDMVMRCHNPNKERYNCYGARGIVVEDRWRNFKNFYDDMYDSYKNGLSIERKNVNGNYSPSNCIWILKEEQKINKQKPLLTLTINGVTKNVCDWIKETGVSPSGVYSRIKIGLPDFECLFGKRATNTQERNYAI